MVCVWCELGQGGRGHHYTDHYGGDHYTGRAALALFRAVPALLYNDSVPSVWLSAVVCGHYRDSGACIGTTQQQLCSSACVWFAGAGGVVPGH